MFNLHSKKKNVIILGANGMLGHDVVELLIDEQKKAQSCIGIVTPLTSKDIDITEPFALSKHVCRNRTDPHVKYDYVINCAAMTDTKKIETDAAYRSRAYDVNALSLKHIANICAINKIKLIHISTDYVFSQFSTKDQLPYGGGGAFSVVDAFTELSHEFPVNVYGMQKLIGEKFIKEGMKQSQYTILRTSWLYGAHNCKSFVHKFLKNFMSKKKEHDVSYNDIFEFEMTQNEHSIPTSSETLAYMILNTIKYNLHGIFAACGTAASSGSYAVSRKQWAEEILKLWLNPEEFAKCKIVGVDCDTLAPKFSRMYNECINRDYQKLYDGIDRDWKQDLCCFLLRHKDSIEQFINN